MEAFLKSKQTGNTNAAKEDFLHAKCIEEILALSFNKKNTKISSDALKRITEVVKIFIDEAAVRSAIQAKSESIDNEIVEVTPQHLEKVLPQLLLDF